MNGHWQAASNLSVDVNPYFWYGYGTGGNELFTFREGGAATTPAGVHGGIRDSNGDGDVLALVQVLRRVEAGR